MALLILSLGCTAIQGGTDTSNAITKDMCAQYHGNWGACGTGQCCHCGGIAGFGCPPGYVCIDYEPGGAADAMGVCKKASE